MTEHELDTLLRDYGGAVQPGAHRARLALQKLLKEG